MKVHQVQFERMNDNGSVEHTTAWVGVFWKLKPGKIVSFEGETKRWLVVSVGSIIEDSDELHKTWKVGGLAFYRKPPVVQ